MTPQLARTMASYNRWMNERLYAACTQLSDAERKRDRKAFFRSIHGTLNHLLLGDKIWLGRFEGLPFHFHSLDEDLHADFHELERDRNVTDDRIDAWASRLTAEALAGTLEYTSIVSPQPRTCGLGIAVAHLFNHQTHHRGQLTTLLSQSGVDYGTTDLMWLPEVLQAESNAGRA